MKDIQADLPVLYLTNDIHEFPYNKIATFANDTFIIGIGEDHEGAAILIQIAINKISDWTISRRNKQIGTKPVHVHFTNKMKQHIPVGVQNIYMSYSNTGKYLNIEMHWLLGCQSTMSISKNNFFISNCKIHVAYDTHLWNSTSKRY